MMAGGAGFEPAVSGIKTRCLTRLGEPPKVVGPAGLEPARSYEQKILSLHRLPFRHGPVCFLPYVPIIP